MGVAGRASDVTSRLVFGALARLVPTLFSGFVWLTVAALSGGWFPLLAAGLVLAVIGGRRWRGLFGWRHGARAATEAEAAAVWAVLVPVQQLRGRGQPKVWIDTQGRAGVEALTHHDLAVPPATVLALLRGQADADVFCAATCWTLGIRKARGDGLGHALAEVFWLPASLAVAMFGGPIKHLVRLPLIRSAWALRFIYAPIALWQQWATPRFGYAIAACVVLALTYAAPWWGRCYARELCLAGDAEVVRCGMGRVWVAQLRRLDASLGTEQRAARLEAAANRTVQS